MDKVFEIFKNSNILILTEDFKNTNVVCEYKCLVCGHLFKAGLKYKIGQIKRGGNGCPKCSKKQQTLDYTKKDPETGKSRADIVAIKGAKTMSKKDPITGLSIYDQTGKKIKKTVDGIDPLTGLSLAKTRGQKTRETKLKIDSETGESVYEKTARKSARTKSIQFLDNLKYKFRNEFKLYVDIDSYVKNKVIKYKCIKCDTVNSAYQPYIRCYNCNPIKIYKISNGENEIYNFCKSIYNGIIIKNDRTVVIGENGMQELDLYFPDLNFAIEFNGMYWHSEIMKSKQYHLNKTNQCRDKNIQLVHIFENEWQDLNKQKIWKSVITNKLRQSVRLYARKCKIGYVNRSDKKIFLDDNHLQGTCGSSRNLGLYYKNELVSIMTFGKSRYKKRYEWELLRFCNKIGYSVIGGASKLFSEFIKTNNGTIITYADKSRSDGNLYKQLKFTKLQDSEIGYWWYKDNILENRMKYQKAGLYKKLKIFDNKKTEIENMHDNGYIRIFNCGNQTWEYTIN